jgi:basic membrane protein A and related proteins
MHVLPQSLVSRRVVLGAAVGIGTQLLVPRAIAAGTPLRVAAVYSGSAEQPWISRVHAALNNAREKGSITYRWAESVRPRKMIDRIRDFAVEGADLIVGEAFTAERDIRLAAAELPKIQFLMASSFQPSLPNFSVFDSYIHEPVFLAGMVAGKLTTANSIGLVGTFPVPQVNRLLNAFIAGVRDVNKEVKLGVTFTQAQFDPDRAGRAVKKLVKDGADVVFGERTDAVDVAKAKGLKAIGALMTANNGDRELPIASAIWNVEPTIDRIVGDMARGDFQPADYGAYSHMAFGGSALSQLDEARVGSEVIAMVTARQAEILNGTFKVPLDDSTPQVP